MSMVSDMNVKDGTTSVIGYSQNYLELKKKYDALQNEFQEK